MKIERGAELKEVDVADIVPGIQVREHPDEELEALAASIKEFGIVQPITVRRRGEKYEIIAGERRWRAAKKAGLKKIPAIIQAFDDTESALASLIENVHRKDLNEVEKARGVSEIYMRHGIDIEDARKYLETLVAAKRQKLDRELTSEEWNFKKIADKIGLRYEDQLYYIGIAKELTEEEKERIVEMELGKGKVEAIVSISEPEKRKVLIEIAKETPTRELEKIAKIVRGEVPEQLKEAVLRREIAPEIADAIKDAPVETIPKLIKDVKALRLEPKEAEELKKAYIAGTVMELIEERIREISVKTLVEEEEERRRNEILEKLKELHTNLDAHTYLLGALEHIRCPICGSGSENFGWKCHNLSVKEAIERIKKEIDDVERGGERKHARR